jgi:hypothetical protein
MSELKVEDVERHFAQLAELEKEFDKVDVEIRESPLPHFFSFGLCAENPRHPPVSAMLIALFLPSHMGMTCADISGHPKCARPL